MEPWWREVVMLLASGMEDEAIKITRKAAAQGSLPAKVRLARFGDAAGIAHNESDRIVDQAEVEIHEDDATCHWALWGAYELLLGSCEYDERSRRALRHLEAFARITGDPQAVFAVGVNYANGRIGVESSIEQAVDWFYCAAALGHPGAMRAIRKVRNA